MTLQEAPPPLCTVTFLECKTNKFYNSDLISQLKLVPDESEMRQVFLLLRSAKLSAQLAPSGQNR